MGTNLLAMAALKGPSCVVAPFFSFSQLFSGKGVPLKSTNQKKDAPFSYGHWASEIGTLLH